MTLPSSKVFLLFAAVFGVFAVAEVVQQNKNLATQSGITLILHTVAQEIVTAIFAVGLGCFFLARAKKPVNKHSKLEKNKLKTKKCSDYEPDSDASTAEGDSDGPNDDSDSEGTPSANVTPRSPCLSPAIPKVQMPSPQTYQRPKQRIVRDDLFKSKTMETNSDSWRKDAARFQATPKMPPKSNKLVVPQAEKAAELPGAKSFPTGSTSMPSTLSKGGCALLELLREEQKSKLTKESATGELAAPPGL